MSDVKHTTVTLRDYFAGQAITGALIDLAKSGLSPHDERIAADTIARSAYILADAMLAASTTGKDEA